MRGVIAVEVATLTRGLDFEVLGEGLDPFCMGADLKFHCRDSGTPPPKKKEVGYSRLGFGV